MLSRFGTIGEKNGFSDAACEAAGIPRSPWKGATDRKVTNGKTDHEVVGEIEDSPLGNTPQKFDANRGRDSLWGRLRDSGVDPEVARATADKVMDRNMRQRE